MDARGRAVPTPYDLFEAPELASVEALTAVLDVTVAAVVAANPELLDDGWRDGPRGPSAQVWIADTIDAYAHAHAHALRAVLNRYRTAVELARNDPRRAIDEVPF